MLSVTRSRKKLSVRRLAALIATFCVLILLTYSGLFSFLKKDESDRSNDQDIEQDIDIWNALPDDDDEIKVFGELAEKEVRMNRDIFFFVVSGARNLTLTEACLVESAARLHPSRRVFVLFLSSEISDVYKSKSLSAMLSFENIYLRYVQLKKYMVHPDAKHWFVNSNFHKTDNFKEFLNDAMTYAFLEKFGGTILDFETLVLRPLPPDRQFFSRCHEDQINSRPINLNSRHPVLNDLQSTLEKTYDSESHDSIGHQLLTSTLKRQCQVEFIKELLYKDCTKSAWIMPVELTCPVPERKGQTIFEPARSELVVKKLTEAESLSLKLWSRKSPKSWGSEKSQTAFFKLAKKLCPVIHQRLGSAGSY